MKRSHVVLPGSPIAPVVTHLERQLRKLWTTLMPSTVIRTFRYDAAESRLVVEFQSGRRYAYFNVPPNIYEDMRRARSRGSYFNAWVRDRYSYARLQ